MLAGIGSCLDMSMSELRTEYCLPFNLEANLRRKMDLVHFQQNDEWITSSNESMEIALISPSDVYKFKPLFTYTVFGDEEVIFGYKNIHIKMEYLSGSLMMYLGIVEVTEGISFDSQIPNCKAQDVVGMLSTKLPKGAMCLMQVQCVLTKISRSTKAS
jgi:Histone acetyl transferase HAT1 N-terminus